MQSSWTTLLLICLTIVGLFGFKGGQSELLGFTAERAAAQLELELDFDQLLNTDNLRVWMQRMTAKPHHVGSPHAKANAEFMVELFRSWGYEADTVVYHVLFPTPRERHLELLAPRSYTAKLIEPEVEGDATSSLRTDRLPPYNAYSADGDVTGELVYVNQGLPRDYDVLRQRGIDVQGKIVIVRYGGSWRGIKVKLAALHGAIGCILYSDPRDDGYWQGDAYPKGPYRWEFGTQRGSIMDMPLFPGDPLTPGVGATRDAERLSREEAPTLMRIPVLPIGWGDAKPLLESLEGPVAPPDWRGALPLTYHVGPGPARVRLKVAFDWNLTPVYNVMATLKGLDYPDEWVIRGNHRDAWVFGAHDPISGMVALMEEARAIGMLAQQGRSPRRTLIYAGWDAEEQGLLGSTEWAEHKAAELRQKAIIYINTDSNARGFLSAGGSHTLERLVNEVAESVMDPQTQVTVGTRQRARRRVQGNAEADSREDLRMFPLGSGSDYTPFLQHLGIASLNIGFGGEGGGGNYHSSYDSFDYYLRFGDPGFEYGIALAKVAGRLSLRMANADVLPLRMTNFADNVRLYAEEVEALVPTLRQETLRHNRLLDTRSWELAEDPARTFIAPDRKDEVPHINFAPLKNALAALQASSLAYDRQLADRAEHLTESRKAAINQVLLNLERTMSREDGLPGRDWFKHHIYAPGFLTGYGVKTLPGIREALEARSWAEAERQVVIAAEVLSQVAAAIDQAAALMAEG
ncbi:MAG: M28 family peptidase [Bacteroidota bacterium]|nr:M28 family peptidase [Bacteroidota bacterium]